MTEAEEKRLNDRIKELLEHNNTQLMENRAQRAIIKTQKIQIMWLLSQIPGVQP
jgi:adenylyl- and sulfurtransferase ThiI